MSHTADNDTNSESINNHVQYPHPHYPQQHQHQHQQHFVQSNTQFTNTPAHSQNVLLNPSLRRSTFNFSAPSCPSNPYAALVPQVLQGQDTSPSSVTVSSQQPTWGLGPELLSKQQNGLVGAAPSLPPGVSSYQPDMRYLQGPLDILNAEQYDDGHGRYAKRRGPSKVENNALSAIKVISNPKKRGRKTSQNDHLEPEEETKRARGRPRLDIVDHQDLKERRKEQIRLAQRAYRERKETAITVLEKQVAELRANNDEIRDAFQSMLLDYANKHGVLARVPELGQRLQKFQALLTQKCSDVGSPQSDEATEVKPSDDAFQVDHALSGNITAEDEAAPQDATLPVSQQPQPLFGGIVVTHEPEVHSVSQDVSVLDSSLNDDLGNYTVVKLPSYDNASFAFDLNVLNSMQDYMPSSPWNSLAIPFSGAHLENTLARRLHRRATEKAADLLHMENPPFRVMHRVFGFVTNYDSLDDICQRLKDTLDRRASEDLNAYGQPFHHIGGAGTHFAGDTKAMSYSSGAPFPNAGFGMGPFNEKTTEVSNKHLDALQRTELPGWKGEWFDSYDVQKYLDSKHITLPQGGGGYVLIPPGDFYHNPTEGQSTAKKGLEVSVPAKEAPNFGIFPSVGDGISIPSALQTTGRNVQYPSPVSSVDSMLSISASTDVWPSGSMGTDFLGISQATPNNMPSLLAYDASATLGYPEPSQFVYSSSGMNHISSQTSMKRVWMSVDKFIEQLISRATCVGRGPAFRKEDIMTAFWEAVRPEPE
ncbi:hypothetical protein F5Y19DRAFT_473585 [Xylariaceae sp. FL1651]|nr:hypothetical protein F5Y19DRAFT_473585 [Xylariaceae sp. FL1651]